jgi:hypothetical protein
MKILSVPIEERISGETLEKYNQVLAIIEGRTIAGGAARQLYFNKDFGSTDIDLFSWYDDAPLKNYSGYKLRTHWAYTFKIQNYTIQLIRKGYSGSVENIFNSFDFNCCCFAVDRNYIYYTEEAIEDCNKKQLRYIDNYNEESHDFEEVRLLKYIKKGFLPACEGTRRALGNLISTIYIRVQEMDFIESYEDKILDTIYFISCRYPS